MKMSSHGISLILNEETPFEELLSDVAGKFRENSSFFTSARVVLSFEGRHLSDEEERLLINEILDNSSLELACIMEKDPDRETVFLKALKVFEESEKSAGAFYHGDIARGQTVYTDTSCIVLGSVHQGGEIVSRGNIVILGGLRGRAFAGFTRDDFKLSLPGAEEGQQHFVAALDMMPELLIIDDVDEEFPVSEKKSSFFSIRSKNTAKIAFVVEGKIAVEELTAEETKNLMMR